jgi:hypothetical protein
MKTIFGFGGIYDLIVGIRATNAIIKADILPILSSIVKSWKNIPRLIIPNSHKGKKIVAIATMGNL